MCKHKYVLKEIIRVRESYGRSESRCETWRQTDVFFCEKCLEEKVVNKEWCGQDHYSDMPACAKIGEWIKKTIW